MYIHAGTEVQSSLLRFADSDVVAVVNVTHAWPEYGRAARINAARARWDAWLSVICIISCQPRSRASCAPLYTFRGCESTATSFFPARDNGNFVCRGDYRARAGRGPYVHVRARSSEKSNLMLREREFPGKRLRCASFWDIYTFFEEKFRDVITESENNNKLSE